ncbi:MAG: cytochrome [Herminiimonas sp.]|nr:cytochrome [Herminiimonas sp.]
MKRFGWKLAVLALCAGILLVGCKREERQLQTPPTGSAVMSASRMGDLEPGQPQPRQQVKNPYEDNAYAVSQGKKWFRAYNCSGCHAQGGGGIGPALTDDKWIYGAEPASIFSTISQGRPNGMPSFGGHVTEDQIWQLVAYVRSMSGQLRSDVAPSRSDSLQGGKPEQQREKLEPKSSSLPTH